MDKEVKKKSKKGTLIKARKGKINYKSATDNNEKIKRIAVSETSSNLKEIDSCSTEFMNESSAMGLLQELNDKFKKPRLFRKTFYPGIFIIIALLICPFGTLFKVISVLLVVILNVLSFIHDQNSKVTEIFYEFDPETERAYYDLVKSFQGIISCSKKWHVSFRGESRDWKRSSGASSVIKRKPIYIKNQPPPYVKTNVIVPMIPVGKQKLYFFPERILIYDDKGVGVVDYSSLKLEINCIEFVEHGTTPRDAKNVGETWKYPNKDGSPDKRFNDNKKLPIIQYDELLFTSDNGLNELIHISKCGVAKYLAETIANLQRMIG